MHVAVRLFPSGEAVLVCRETGKVLRHLGPQVYLSRVVYAGPGKPKESYAEMTLKVKVPLLCDAGEPFELVGVYADASGCDCPEESPTPCDEDSCPY